MTETVLQARLTDLRHHATDTGFTSSVVVCADGRVVRAIGVMRSPVIGEKLSLSGKFSRHAGFGRVFEFSSYLSAPPDEHEAQAQYLSHLADIPTSIAHAIISQFGHSTFSIIEHHPQKLLECEKVTPDYATALHERWLAARGTDRMLGILSEFDLSKRQMAHLYTKLGSGDGLEKQLRDNPYLLTLHLGSFSFRQAEKVALRLKIPANHPDRITAALLQIVRHNTARGNTSMVFAEVVALLPRILGAPITTNHPLVEAGVQKLLDMNLVRIHDGEIYLADTYIHENTLIAAIARLENGDRHFDTHISEDKVAALLSVESGLANPHALVAATVQSLLYKISAVSVGHNSDARMLARAINGVFARLNGRVIVAVPSLGDKPWFAAYGIDAMCPSEVVQRLPDGTAGRTYSAPCDADLLIVYRAEAFGLVDMAQMLDAMPMPAGCVLIGDPGGMLPFSPGQPFIDLLLSERIPHTTLPQSSDAASAIITGVRDALLGNLETPLPILAVPDDRIAILPLDTQPVAAVRVFYEQYLALVNCDITDSRVFAGLPPSSITDINRAMQEALQPNSAAARHRQIELREGDLVYLPRSCHAKNLPAGSCGRVVAVTPGPRCAVMFHDNQTALFDVSEMGHLSLGYVLPFAPYPREKIDTAMLIIPDGAPAPRDMLYELLGDTNRLVLVGAIESFTKPLKRSPRSTRLIQVAKGFV
jgi:exodeoxyribonuclease V alpha subunit